MATQADTTALHLMLCYVEAECHRIGALDAAHHAAQAVALVAGLRGTREGQDRLRLN